MALTLTLVFIIVLFCLILLTLTLVFTIVLFCLILLTLSLTLSDTTNPNTDL